MKRNVTVCLILSAVFLVTALFSHFYEERMMGLLPVINYPLRPYAAPLAVVGVVLGALGVFLQTRRGK